MHKVNTIWWPYRFFRWVTYVFLEIWCLRRETRKVDQSEGKPGEDAKQGTAYILALLAWCCCWVITWMTEFTLFTRLLEGLIDCLVSCSWKLSVWLLVWLTDCTYSRDMSVQSVRARSGQHVHKISSSSEATMHLLFMRRENKGNTCLTSIRFKKYCTFNCLFLRGEGRAFSNPTKYHTEKPSKNNEQIGHLTMMLIQRWVCFSFVLYIDMCTSGFSRPDILQDMSQVFADMFIFEGVWLPPETMLFEQTIFRDSCLDHPPKNRNIAYVLFLGVPVRLVCLGFTTFILFEFFDLCNVNFQFVGCEMNGFDQSIVDVTWFPNSSHTLIRFSVKMILGVWQNFSKFPSTSCDKYTPRRTHFGKKSLQYSKCNNPGASKKHFRLK